MKISTCTIILSFFIYTSLWFPLSKSTNHQQSLESANHLILFRKRIIQIALHDALRLQSTMNTYHVSSGCAWCDCLVALEDAIFRLNTTLNSYGQTSSAATDIEAQTWLSATLTNLHTCRGLGFSYNSNDIYNDASNSILDAFAVFNKDSSSSTFTYSGADQFEHQKLLDHSKVDLVVAQDGSGDFKTIQSAVNFVASKRKQLLGNDHCNRIVIYVKAGRYHENVRIARHQNNITMFGEGIGRTIVTGNRSVQGGSTTFDSATFAIRGDGFIGKNMSIQNTAGASMGQAVALRSGSDESAFYKCSFEGYQDTLYVHSNRQFFRDCTIYGSVDFIFGNAAVLFQNCEIYVRTNSFHSFNTITAQGRDDPHQNSGIVVHNSQVLLAQPTSNNTSPTKTYLGRPWQKYSRTVFIKTYMGSLIDPAGWLAWGDDSVLRTLFYGEYHNTGPGSTTSGRVSWPGFHLLSNSSQVECFTVENFISGLIWLPSTGIPFTSSL
ncbi:hypothetical protein UlMin_000212 [Ulmus minor]